MGKEAQAARSYSTPSRTKAVCLPRARCVSSAG
jgi:hypothetical protein